MIPLDKELQRVNVKQKPFRQIKVHSGIIKRNHNPVQTWHIQRRGISRTLIYSKPETYLEPWYNQNPGILKTLAYSKPKAYSDIFYVKYLRCQTSTMKRFLKRVNRKQFRNKSFPRSLLHEVHEVVLPDILILFKKNYGARECRRP